jgi:membrane dipeptidase
MPKISAVFLAAAVLICPPSPASAQTEPDGEKALEHTRHLTSDSFLGRKSGTPEYLRAAEYVAEFMREMGLQPAGPDGSYFQHVELKNWIHFEPGTRLDLVSPRPYAFTPGRVYDFVPNRGTGKGVSRGELVFAGYGLDAEGVWNDYRDVEVQGRIVALLAGAPEFLKDLKPGETSTEAKIKSALKRGAAGVIFVAADDTLRGSAPEGAPRGLCPDGFVVMTAKSHVLDRMFDQTGLSWRTHLSRSLRERKPRSLNANGLIVEMAAYPRWEDRTAPNVLGVLPGRDPVLKDEIILIGGHLDHLGVDHDGTIYNGADDNAAAVGVILEIARVLQARGFEPARTLVFAAWAAEELGLRGSRFYVENPVYPLDRTAVYINLDMVGTGSDTLVVGGMWEFSKLFNRVTSRMSSCLKDKFVPRFDYRGSDHTPFLDAGVKALSLRTGDILTRGLDDEHPEYHRPGDVASTIDPGLLAFVAAYHIEMLEYLAETRDDLFRPEDRVEYLHKTSFVADMHCDTIGRFLDGEDLSRDNPSGHVDIPKLREGAVDLQVFACFVAAPDSDEAEAQGVIRGFAQIDAVHRLIEQNPDDLHLILSPEDLRYLRGVRKTGVLIAVEGGYAITGNLALLRTFHRSGVRLMTLTHWLGTEWADASGDPEPVHGGLTDFGREVVREMNRLGMIIDVSHAHDETFWDVIRETRVPIVASHSCARALADHHRNMSDDMLKALAENGGVIGINFLPDFLNVENARRRDALHTDLLRKYGLPEDRRTLEDADPGMVALFREEFDRESGILRKNLPAVDVRTVVDHIDHIVKVTGSADHVGLGSDFDGIGSTPQGLEHIGRIAAVTAELHRRGYTENDIRKILGGNFLRVFQKVSAFNE